MMLAGIATPKWTRSSRAPGEGIYPTSRLRSPATLRDEYQMRTMDELVDLALSLQTELSSR
jgi:hypothetical protein